MQTKCFTNLFVILVFMLTGIPVSCYSQTEFGKDVFKTSGGDLEITFIGHGTLMFSINDKVIPLLKDENIEVRIRDLQ